MTEAEALDKMKRQCKVLSEVFMDTELTAFLLDYRTGTEPDCTYNIRRSIYDALTSAITVVNQEEKRGGASWTRADLFKIREAFKVRGIAVVVRDVT